MSFAAQFLSLKNVVLTFSTGSTADVTELQLKRTIQKDDRTAGSSLVVQSVLDEQNLEVMAKGWNSNNLALADIKPGTQVTSFTAVTTGDSQDVLWPDTATYFPLPWYIGDTDTTLGAKPSQWSTQIHTNIVGVAGA